MVAYLDQTMVLQVGSKNIDYFLEPHHSIVEWDSWVDPPLVGLDSKEIEYLLGSDHSIDEWVYFPLVGLESK